MYKSTGTLALQCLVHFLNQAMNCEREVRDGFDYEKYSVSARILVYAPTVVCKQPQYSIGDRDRWSPLINKQEKSVQVLAVVATSTVGFSCLSSETLQKYCRRVHVLPDGRQTYAFPV